MSGANAAPAAVANQARVVEPNGGEDLQPVKEFKFCTRLISFTTDWTIKNFVKVTNSHIRHNQDNCVPYLRTSDFSPPDFPRLLFSLDVRPWGYDANHRDFVSMFLFLTAPSEQLVLFDLSLLNEKGEKRYTRTFMKRIQGTGTGVGAHDYIRRAELLDPDSGLLGDEGSITVRLEGNLVVEGPVKGRDARLKELLAKEMKGSLTLHPLYEPLEFTDVTLKVSKDGAPTGRVKEFQAHRVVLCKRSPVFAAMFGHDMKERKENVAEIKNITPDVFSEMLKYMYTGQLPKLDSIAMELFEAADRYQMDNLKEICEEALCLQMEDNTQTMETLLGFNRMAKLYNSEKLAEKSLAMMQKQARAEFEKTFVASITTVPDLEAHISGFNNILASVNTPPPTNSAANSRQPAVATRKNPKRARKS